MSNNELSYDTIRRKNDLRLRDRLPSIGAGDDVKVLEPFAKAYLGLYMDMDKSLPPDAKVRMLANEGLARTVLTGLAAAVTRQPLPTPADIGRRQAAGNGDRDDYAVGYIVLAGMDLLSCRTIATPGSRGRDPSNRNDPVSGGTAHGRDGVTAVIDALGAPILEAALCFYYANPAYSQQPWVDHVIKRRPAVVVRAMCAYWQALVEQGTEYLPGFQDLIRDGATRALAAQAVVPVLRACGACRPGFVCELLAVALRYMPATALLDIIEDMLSSDRIRGKRSRTYWLASGFLLAPERFYPELAAYVGSSREKALPLLDFVFDDLKNRTDRAHVLPAHSTAQLLRIIAPVFPPRSTDQAAADDIARKVLWLFDVLAGHRDVQGRRALAWLRSARVMNRCTAILDQVAARQGAA